MPKRQPNLDWATGFPEHFLSILNPQAVGGLCRQLGIRPRGLPKLSVFELLMVLVGHGLAPAGDLATNFTDLSSPIILTGSGNVTTNYLDGGGATNQPARFYRVRLAQ